MISTEFSEILGFLCAEGCHIHLRSSYSYIDKKKNKVVFVNNKLQNRIEFGNKNPILLQRFQDLLIKEFNYFTNPGVDRICICKHSIIHKIISQTPLGHQKWKVPSDVINSKPEVITSFIRGYFEGDGTISNRLRFFSTNKIGLEEFSVLLSKLNLQHKFNGPFKKEGKKDSYEIYVFEKEKTKFMDTIKLIIKRLKS